MHFLTIIAGEHNVTGLLEGLGYVLFGGELNIHELPDDDVLRLG